MKHTFQKYHDVKTQKLVFLEGLLCVCVHSLTDDKVILVRKMIVSPDFFSTTVLVT